MSVSRAVVGNEPRTHPKSDSLPRSVGIRNRERDKSSVSQLDTVSCESCRALKDQGSARKAASV